MKRIQEIEILKFVAIVSMVFVHVSMVSNFESLVMTTNLEQVLGDFIAFMGEMPGAPAFMFAMGWGAFFSRSSATKYFTRLPQLFFLGFLINLFYFASLTIYEINTDSFEEKFMALFNCDIYFFAALASIYLAAMKILRDTKQKIFLSVILLVICAAIRIIFGVDQNYSDSIIGGFILNLFIRNNDLAHFPFTCWIKKLSQFILNASKNIMTIYVLHWMVLFAIFPVLLSVESIFIDIFIALVILIFVCKIAEIMSSVRKNF